MRAVCHVERRRDSKVLYCTLVVLAGGTWAIRVASAGEIGCGVRGYVVREEGLSTRETRVAKSRRQGVRRRGWKRDANLQLSRQSVWFRAWAPYVRQSLDSCGPLLVDV